MGTVSAVYDGNTVELQADTGDSYRIVLYGIDCPELSQPYGPEARALVESRLIGRKVDVQIHGKDRSGNYLAVIDPDGNDVRIDLLNAGLAWTAERDPLPELELLREKAVAAGRGLWLDDAPVPPWTFRREQTMSRPKSR